LRQLYGNLDIKAAERLLADAWRLDVNGWIYARINGEPYNRGFQNGYLLAYEALETIESLKLFVEGAYKRSWRFFRETGMNLFWPKLSEEYKTEISGILEGIRARQVTNVDLEDIVALNGYFDVVSYHYWLKSKEGPGQVTSNRGEHCSAFIATGKTTKDGKVVLAHNTWFSYLTGAGYNVILSVSPSSGNEFLMQAYPATICSGTDWYISKSGLVVAETTITGLTTFSPQGIPYFMRARKAIQYSETLDEWTRTMIEGNNGGYACDWLVGDVKTGEIACLELGTYNYTLDRTFNGIFAGSNVAASEKVQSETTINYSDKSMSCTARRERWKELVESNREPLDVGSARKFLADHYDTYLRKDTPGRNSLCGHIDEDNRGWPEWEQGPYYPAGSFDGKITDSELASVGAFWAHWGKPCDTPFIANSFLTEHPEYGWQKPHLKDIQAYPWILIRTYPKWRTQHKKG